MTDFFVWGTDVGNYGPITLLTTGILATDALLSAF